ncbi:hypothetical protein GJ744_005353 [Endocarpon pusillum]|uniref:Uncharacterized protein n=1 Tax=Endocarpon pusillum TaxID=364733 RepID=A0A8H7E6I1_9EURO|nr:hypothetical protein GJ744_005353 [Endocarpon pusillum]
MSYTPAGTAKRDKVRVRFDDDEHRIKVAEHGAKLLNLPPPSPAPAHMRRRKPVYRPVLRALEVLILCLVVVILVLMAVWAYHLAFGTSSSRSEIWKRDMLRKMSVENIKPPAIARTILHPRSILEKRLSKGVSIGILAGAAAVGIAIAIILLTLRPRLA